MHVGTSNKLQINNNAYVSFLCIINSLATIDIPWDLYDRKFLKPFTVLRYEDLNYMSGMREGREVSIQKQIDSSAWFFSRSSLGLVTIKAQIPRCGFAPGMFIKRIIKEFVHI